VARHEPLRGESARLSWMAACSSASSAAPLPPASSSSPTASQSASLRPPCEGVRGSNKDWHTVLLTTRPREHSAGLMLRRSCHLDLPVCSIAEVHSQTIPLMMMPFQSTTLGRTEHMCQLQNQCRTLKPWLTLQKRCRSFMRVRQSRATPMPAAARQPTLACLLLFSS